MNSRPDVVIPEADRKALEIIQTSSMANKDMQIRASILLLAGEGYNNVEIAQKLNVGQVMVGRWVNRYLGRAPGTDLNKFLRDQHPKGKNRVYSNEARSWLRAFFAEHPGISVLAYTDLVHETAAEAGFPELSNIARTSIAAILKAEDA